jgi:hypothetical protein
LETECLILAAGHSARDIYSLLYERKVELQQKAFSIGVRIEHRQELVSAAQYGKAAGHPALGAANYRLSCQLPSGRSVYTFCMCPGGEVVAAASESGGVVTNGMSRFLRDGENANAALLASLTPADFGSGSSAGRGAVPAPMGKRRLSGWAAGIIPPRHSAWATFCWAARPMGPVLSGRRIRSACASVTLPAVLPAFAITALREAVPVFDRRLRGFADPDALLTGVETRSSAPVRIVRDESGQSSLRGLYPCGEGAGYAGGHTVRSRGRSAHRRKSFGENADSVKYCRQTQIVDIPTVKKVFRPTSFVQSQCD